MFDLFNITRDGKPSLTSPGNWISIKRTLELNLDKIVNYYQQYPQYINSSHVLIRLIYAMNISRKVDLQRYHDYCKQRSFTVAQSIRLTSSLSKGQVWDGEFYGKGSKELIIASEDWFDLDASDRNWKSLQSVKVLHHCKSDLTCNIPDGRVTSAEQGLAVLSVNIPMLMVQYYHWDKEQVRNSERGMLRQTVMQFIFSYVLTNMVYSHFDYAIFNRMRLLSTRKPVGVSFLRHSFGLASVHSDVDNALKIVDGYISEQNLMDFYSKLLNIPTLFAKNFAEVAELPDVAPTLQLYWALIATRLNIIAYVIGTYDSPRRMLSKDLNAIHRVLKMHNVEASIRSNLGADIWKTVESDYNRIKNA